MLIYACPVGQIIVRLAKEKNFPVTMLIDTSHELSDSYSMEAWEKCDRAKLMIWAKKLGLNISKLTDGELRIFIKILQQSEAYKRNRRR